MHDNKSLQNQEEIKSMKNVLKNFNEKLKINNSKDSFSKSKKEKDNSIGMEIIDKSEIFLKEYNSGLFEQFSDLYFLRLNQMRKSLFEISKEKWKDVEICTNVVQLEEGKECVLVGNLYKDMPQKPQYLKGLDSILGAKKISNFVDEVKDYLVIEDETGRIKLNTKNLPKEFSASNFVTGICYAVKGRSDEKGIFFPKDMLFNEIPYESKRLKEIFIEKNSKNSQIKDFTNFLNSSNDELIILVSGLNFGEEDNNGKFNLARKLLINFIQGNSSNSLNNKILAKKLKKFFIIGNLVSPPEDSDLVEKGSYSKQKLNTFVYRQILQSYDAADNFLQICSNSIPTYLMPGEKDISSSYFPQGNLSELMFLQSKQNINRTLFLKANPFYLELNGFSFLISSGQNVDNIRKFSLINKINGKDENSALKVMEKIIDWGHLCPSAPDTLRTWPVKNEDPLVLKEIPNVFISGNQKYFEEDFMKYKNNDEKIIKLISVPNFKETFSFVILDSKNLESFEYKIEIF